MSLSFWITTCSGIGVMAMLLHADAGPTSAPAGDRALLDSVAKAQESGNFAEAEAALDKALATPDGAACTECQVAREILRRIRIDFSQTPDALLAKVRKDIPDVSADDLERWRGQGVLQHRMIDGQVCYFNREPANLYRFCAEAKPGQILRSQRVLTAVETLVEGEPVGDVSLKGISRPVKIFNLVRLTK